MPYKNPLSFLWTILPSLFLVLLSTPNHTNIHYLLKPPDINPLLSYFPYSHTRGQTFYFTFRSNPSFSAHPPFLLLPYSRPLTPILCTFSLICLWVDQQCMETFLEQPPPPISDASTSILTMLFGWVYLESSFPHDVTIPLHSTLPLHHTSKPPNNPNFTPSSSFLIPSHSLTHYLSI